MEDTVHTHTLFSEETVTLLSFSLPSSSPLHLHHFNPSPPPSLSSFLLCSPHCHSPLFLSPLPSLISLPSLPLCTSLSSFLLCSPLSLFFPPLLSPLSLSSTTLPLPLPPLSLLSSSALSLLHNFLFLLSLLSSSPFSYMSVPKVCRDSDTHTFRWIKTQWTGVGSQRLQGCGPGQFLSTLIPLNCIALSTIVLFMNGV